MRGTKNLLTSTMGSPKETEEEANAARKTFTTEGGKRSWKRLRRGFAILAATPPSKAEDQRPANPRETDSTQIAGGMRNDPGHASISPNLSLIFPHVVQRSAKRRGYLLSYSQAEPGRELTQPNPRRALYIGFCKMISASSTVLAALMPCALLPLQPWELSKKCAQFYMYI